MKKKEKVIGFANPKKNFCFYVIGQNRNGLNYKAIQKKLLLLSFVMVRKIQNFLFLVQVNKKILLLDFGILVQNLSIIRSNCFIQ